jgi:hypothetical protein
MHIIISQRLHVMGNIAMFLHIKHSTFERRCEPSESSWILMLSLGSFRSLVWCSNWLRQILNLNSFMFCAIEFLENNILNYIKNKV